MSENSHAYTPLPRVENTFLVHLHIRQVNKETIHALVSLDWTILELKEKVFPEEARGSSNVRIIYQGKLLENQMTLRHYGIEENFYVHAAISEAPPPRPPTPRAPSPVNRHVPIDIMDVEAIRVFEEERQSPFEGSSSDMLFGFLMGFLIGIIMVIWLWQPRISRKQKIGILAGVTANVFMSFLIDDPGESPVHQPPAPTSGPPFGVGPDGSVPLFGDHP